MPTKLSRYCEGIMEAACLAALIFVPVFFNVYSSRIFEPDKITVLRSLALLVLGAWLLKLIEEGGIRWENSLTTESRLKFIIKYPLLAPVIALVVLYIVSTIFSVAPRTSFWGSYQRLQGTYTTFSYLVIFAAVLGNVRRREQIERILTTVILSSIPVALYGILQRYQIDPIPWAGDTYLRIAANMGNSIFVAAYLIIVFPLTAGRIVQSFSAILKEEAHLWRHVARATIYLFAAAVQVMAIYLSGSRGPALGWLAGLFFMFLLLTLTWGKRWLTLGTIGMAAILAVFLIVFNIKGGPLEGLRSSPAIGRFGLLLDPESNSALVRKYIWQGAAELVKPHAPIEYPDGRKDAFNILRPLIGYGPEAMYVAYNPFYVPELALVEKRNASPDRSHNETWDALVITGIAGIFVYLFVFTVVFYYGLKWIGLIPTGSYQRLFGGLWLGAGVLVGVGLSLWRGLAYFGVGLPIGMLLGLLAYIVIIAFKSAYQPPENTQDLARTLVLIVLLTAIVSHFVEINFGIAIASTRLYFWVYAALLVVVGYIMPALDQSADSPVQDDRASLAAGKKKRKARPVYAAPGESWISRNREALISAFTVSLVMVVLGYDFITNARGIKSSSEIIWVSFTRLPQRDNALSYGVLSMLLTSWFFISLVFAAEHSVTEARQWWKGFAITLGVSAGIALFYWFFHAQGLAAIANNTANSFDQVLTQVSRFERLISRFYFAGILVVLWLAVVLTDDHLVEKTAAHRWSPFGAALILISVIAGAVITNIRVVQADIVFKIAEPFTRSGQWQVAIAIYNRANELAPHEDYYFLFLGRAFLEHAKTLPTETEKDRFFQDAELELKKAQSLNPLNTDHTANLARLYSMWASFAQETETRQQRGNVSSEYFSRALALSRNSAMLWDEWATLYLFTLQQPEEALEKLARAKEIDPKYHRTYALLAEYYLRKAVAENDATAQREAFLQAAENLKAALQMSTTGEPSAKFNYAQMLAGAYVQLSQLPDAIESYLAAIQYAPSGVALWQIHEALARLYAQVGDSANATIHLQYALQDAPDDQTSRLQTLGELISAGGQP